MKSTIAGLAVDGSKAEPGPPEQKVPQGSLRPFACAPQSHAGRWHARKQLTSNAKCAPLSLALALAKAKAKAKAKANAKAKGPWPWPWSSLCSRPNIKSTIAGLAVELRCGHAPCGDRGGQGVRAFARAMWSR